MVREGQRTSAGWILQICSWNELETYDPIKSIENTAARALQGPSCKSECWTPPLFFFSTSKEVTSWSRNGTCGWSACIGAAPAATLASGAQPGRFGLGDPVNATFQFQSHVVSHFDPTSSLWTSGSNECKISTKKTVKTTAYCGRTKPNRVSGGFKQKIEINLIFLVTVSLDCAVKTEYWSLLP